jgi:hypothetical protein
VVAELSLGFWRYLSVKRHEKHLWVPYLHHAFPAGPTAYTMWTTGSSGCTTCATGRPPRTTAWGNAARPPVRYCRPGHADQRRPGRLHVCHQPDSPSGITSTMSAAGRHVDNSRQKILALAATYPRSRLTPELWAKLVHMVAVDFGERFGEVVG